MGHVFQDGWWARNPSVCSFGCLWLRKLAKPMANALKRKKRYFGTFIYENNGKLRN